MKKIIYKRVVPLSIAWAFFIFILCATPGAYIPSVSWLDLLSFDKFVHAGIFFVLCCLLFTAAIKFNNKTVVYIFIFFVCVAYGGLLEIMQAKCFSDRSADWKDFVANSFGCLVAVLLLKKLKIYFLQ